MGQLGSKISTTAFRKRKNRTLFFTGILTKWQPCPCHLAPPYLPKVAVKKEKWRRHQTVFASCCLYAGFVLERGESVDNNSFQSCLSKFARKYVVMYRHQSFSTQSKATWSSRARFMDGGFVYNNLPQSGFHFTSSNSWNL